MSDSPRGFDPHGTTILCVRRDGLVAMGGDGQVTLGNTVMKGNARKVRRLHDGQVIAGFAGGTADAFTLFERFESKLQQFGNLTRAAIELAKDWRSDRSLRRLGNGSVIAGFAGGTADAFTLFERFEAKLEKHGHNLTRAAVELAKDWRTDRMLRRLEAMLAVADRENSLIITGNGDVLEPELGIVAIGSGGPYAQSAARALLENTELAPAEIVKKSLTIAGDLCIYTNQSHAIEVLE